MFVCAHNSYKCNNIVLFISTSIVPPHFRSILLNIGRWLQLRQNHIKLLTFYAIGIN